MRDIRSNETLIQRGERSRKEALSTPYICLNFHRSREAWQIRVLKNGYCHLLTMDNDEPTKCTYCLIDHPYTCRFRVTAQALLFKKLFDTATFRR